MNLQGKHVAILGAGRSGRAAARLARREGARVTMYDTGVIPPLDPADEGISLHPNVTEADGAACECDVLVVSPGIDTYGPFVAAFAKNAGEVIGEVELAARYFPGVIVGITGTNGKTTTTELIQRVLEAGGYTARACGNYGVPFAEVVLENPVPTAVSLELSSFQLETIATLRPKVSVWLNFAPDHMDRYPTVEAYFEAKKRIFLNQTEEDVAIIRAGEPLGALMPRVLQFSTDGSEADYTSDGHSVLRKHEFLMSLDETQMRGLHNAENAMAALAVADALGIPQEAARKAMAGYAPPLHRCELIRTLDGVEYLNDSKATNLHALVSALRSQTRPVVLVAGGKEKGLDYRPVLPLLREKALASVTFGQIGEALGKLFSEAVPTQRAETFEKAVELARAAAPRGSTVLFSPGTSSFDMFSGYEARGNAFRDLVHNLR